MCYEPVTFKNKTRTIAQPGETITVPCGKCIECNMARSNQWFIRLKYELKEAVSAHFVTLTYANPPLSFNGHYTGRKSDLQQFFKRLRHYDATKKRNPKTKRMKKYWNTKLRYYAVLEYGERYQRPHYHFIIFNLRSKSSVDKAWTKDGLPIGNVHFGEVEDASIKYVTGYIGKKVGIPTDDDDDRLKEFSLMSQGLGTAYLGQPSVWNVNNQEAHLVVEGVTYCLPRYYKQKLWPSRIVIKTAKHKDKDGNQVYIKSQVQHPIARSIGEKIYKRSLNRQELEIQLYPGSPSDYFKNRMEIAHAKTHSSKKLSQFS